MILLTLVGLDLFLVCFFFTPLKFGNRVLEDTSMCEVFALHPVPVSVLWPPAVKGLRAVECRYGDIQVDGAGLPTVPGLTGEHGRL